MAQKSRRRLAGLSALGSHPTRFTNDVRYSSMSKNIRRVRATGIVLAHGLWQHGISFKAIGLLYTLLDLAELPDWEFSIQGLVALSQQHGVGDGRDAIRSAIAELEEKRLLVRERERGDNGQLGGTHWLVSDSPIADADENPAPATGLPASENPTEGIRLQQGSSSYEEEKKEEIPCKSPRSDGQKDSFADRAMAIWNSQAPAHWIRIRAMGKQRVRKLVALANQEFGSQEATLTALEQSLQQAQREDWCMKPSAQLTLENWLTNGKVRQYSEKWLEVSSPASAASGLSPEQREVADIAKDYPALFRGVSVRDGHLMLQYTIEAQQAAGYPAEATVSTIGAIGEEIAFLTAAMERSRQSAPVVVPF